MPSRDRLNFRRAHYARLVKKNYVIESTQCRRRQIQNKR